MSSNYISSIWDFSDVSTAETNYLTHDFLRWYGKLVPQLAGRIVDMYSEQGDVVLANFSGSGTVALEASIRGRNVVGVDANPLSLLLSRVKANPYTGDVLALLAVVESNFLSIRRNTNTGVGNLSKWFHEGQDADLVALRHSIDLMRDSQARDLFVLALASIVKKVSRVDARCVNHLVTDRSKVQVEILPLFRGKVLQMAGSIRSLSEHRLEDSEVTILQGDARQLPVADESVDLVISHPPYLGAIDYSNMYQLENAVLGFDDSKFKVKDISTNALSKYLESMRDVFTEMFRVAKPGRRIVVVIGDNRKAGLLQPTFAHFILDAQQRLGLQLEDIFIWVTSSKAGMALKRHGNYIDHNYVLVFRK